MQVFTFQKYSVVKKNHYIFLTTVFVAYMQPNSDLRWIDATNDWLEQTAMFDQKQIHFYCLCSTCYMLASTRPWSSQNDNMTVLIFSSLIQWQKYLTTYILQFYCIAYSSPPNYRKALLPLCYSEGPPNTKLLLSVSIGLMFVPCTALLCMNTVVYLGLMCICFIIIQLFDIMPIKAWQAARC